MLNIRTAPGLAAPSFDQIITRSEDGQLRALTFDLGAGSGPDSPPLCPTW